MDRALRCRAGTCLRGRPWLWDSGQVHTQHGVQWTYEWNCIIFIIIMHLTNGSTSLYIIALPTCHKSSWNAAAWPGEVCRPRDSPEGAQSYSRRICNHSEHSASRRFSRTPFTLRSVHMGVEALPALPSSSSTASGPGHLLHSLWLPRWQLSFPAVLKSLKWSSNKTTLLPANIDDFS